MKRVLLLIIFSSACAFAYAQADIIVTMAGNGTAGYSGDGGDAAHAKINYPEGICLDNKGNLYIADGFNNRIRKVNLGEKIITSIAGNGNTGFSGDGGPAANAEFFVPEAVCTDALGNVYVADAGNNRIRKINILTQEINTIIGSGSTGSGSYSGDGGPATMATLNVPTGVCIDNKGNIYVADYSNNRIRKVDTAGVITTVAGNGVAGYSGDGGSAILASLNGPIQIAVDTEDNIYICDQWNHAVRKVSVETGIISTIAGKGIPGYSGNGGPAVNALLHEPAGVFIDSKNNVYIAEYRNGVIRKIDTEGLISTVVGTGIPGYSGDGGTPENARLRCADIFLDAAGTMYIADVDNNRIRKVYNPQLNVNDPNIEETLLYPNPAVNEITIKGAANYKVAIYDQVGKEVINTIIVNDIQVLNLNSLNSGMYLVEIINPATAKWRTVSLLIHK